MIYDGVVIRLDDLYLFLLDPDKNEIVDGINISEHECYKDMLENQIMVVDVTIKDGTKEIDKVDLDEFIHGDSYGKYDTFIYIHDVQLYSIDRKIGTKKVSLEQLIKKGELNNIAIDCIESAKKYTIKNNE